MLYKIVFYIFVFIGGFIVTKVGISAGWIIGSLLTGILYSFFIRKIKFSNTFFKFAIGFIGVNIGLMIDEDLLPTLVKYSIPLAVSIILILIGSMLLSWILYKNTFLDKKTALFCCMPGGASVMISLSEDYGADSRIVTAFHIVRITIFVLLIPLLSGFIVNADPVVLSNEGESFVFDYALLYKIPILIVVVFVAIFVAKMIKIPSAPFILSMILGFLLNQFVYDVGSMPNYVLSFGQVLLGGVISVRFNRDILSKMNKIKFVSATVMGLYIVLGFAVSLFIYMITSFNFVTSLLSVVPAGAAEMASTAVLLDQDGSLVASFQLIRVLVLTIIIPIIMSFIFRREVE